MGYVESEATTVIGRDIRKERVDEWNDTDTREYREYRNLEASLCSCLPLTLVKESSLSSASSVTIFGSIPRTIPSLRVDNLSGLSLSGVDR